MNIITYRELSSLTQLLGVSAKALYALSNNVTSHYRKVEIPKSDGSKRELCVPDEFLKSVQRKILENLLYNEYVSPFATAYRPGLSTLINAKIHLNQPLILKLDIKNFFQNISYAKVKEKVFDEKRFSENNRILLSMLCVYKESIPQGAPTSPYISNIVMRDFDREVFHFCRERSINYTRYCDDMTFSGEFDAREVIEFITAKLKQNGFVLNRKKTALLKDGTRMCVTGIVVNQKLNTKSEFRKQIRQIVYYCKRYGVEQHLRHIELKVKPYKYFERLLGKINYALSVDESNKELGEYKKWVKQQMCTISDKL